MSVYKTYIEIEVAIDYDFEAGEPTVMYPNDKAHPGSPESVTINSIEFEGIDLLPQMAEWGYMEEEILYSLRGDNQ